MIKAVTDPEINSNDKVKIISKIKSEVIQKQQNSEFMMKVKADLTPKNAAPGLTHKEY